MLRVRLVVNPGADQDRIQRTLERRLPMVRLAFEYVPAIERSLSGKRRYFVDGMQVAVVGGAPGHHDRRAQVREAHRRWMATAGAVLAAAALVMSFLITGPGGNGRSATVRTHRARGSIVSVRLPDHHRAATFASTRRSPSILDGRPRVGV